jgi:hypothetical protein
MRKKAVTQDARLLLQLSRLRKEAEMREARPWARDRFSPQNAGGYGKVEMAHDTQESRWLRQVTTYRGMAASFVLDGALSERAFPNPEFLREIFAFFAKVQPFLKKLRKRTGLPNLMANMEKVILKSQDTRQRLRVETRGLGTQRKLGK